MQHDQFMKICKELVESVKDVFPEHARVNTWIDYPQFSFICNVCWELNKDQDQSKLSRVILIIITRDAIESSCYDERREKVHHKFRSFVQEKFNQFDPNHNEPYGRVPPREEWRVQGIHLNE